MSDATVNVGALLVTWLLLGLLACAAWALTFGRWLNDQTEQQRKAQRALDIADDYRRQARVAAVDGEAWTYLDAAEFWQKKAESLGASLRATSPATEAADPHPSQASPPPITPPWE